MTADPGTLLALAALLAATGAVAGVMAGLLGVGGGILLVPCFHFIFERLGFGGPGLMQVCLATSLATIVVTSARSLGAHHRRGAVDLAILRGWVPGIALGALAGVWVVAGLSSHLLQLIFGALGMAIGAYLGLGRPAWRLGAAMPGPWPKRLLSPVIGLVSVLMGIGGGAFAVPLMSLYGVPIHRAIGTAPGFGLAIAIPSVAAFALLALPPGTRPPFTLGAVNLPGVAVVIAMTLLTAPLGAALAHRLPSRPLRAIFAVFLVTLSALMLRDALAG